MTNTKTAVISCGTATWWTARICSLPTVRALRAVPPTRFVMPNPRESKWFFPRQSTLLWTRVHNCPLFTACPQRSARIYPQRKALKLRNCSPNRLSFCLFSYIIGVGKKLVHIYTEPITNNTTKIIFLYIISLIIGTDEIFEGQQKGENI